MSESQTKDGAPSTGNLTDIEKDVLPVEVQELCRLVANILRRKEAPRSRDNEAEQKTTKPKRRQMQGDASLD